MIRLLWMNVMGGGEGVSLVSFIFHLLWHRVADG